MRFAIILDNKVHYVFEQDIKPEFPPTPEGDEVVVIDITDNIEVQEGWEYNAESSEFKEFTPLFRYFVKLDADDVVEEVINCPYSSLEPMNVGIVEVSYADESIVGCIYLDGEFIDQDSPNGLNIKINALKDLIKEQTTLLNYIVEKSNN